MMALLFAGEKKPKPMPMMTQAAAMRGSGVLASKNEQQKMPAVVSAMPKLATRRGSCLSESAPAMGERIAIIKGCRSRTTPAVEASRPRTSCR